MFSDTCPSSFKNSPSVSATALILIVASAWYVNAIIAVAPELEPVNVLLTDRVPETSLLFKTPVELL